MQDFIRKHRVVFGVIILVFIGVPMTIFFGIPTAPQGADQDSPPLVYVGNEVVTADQFNQGLNNMLQRLRQQQGQQELAREDAIQQMLENGSLNQMLTSMISGAVIRDLANKQNIAFTDEFLAEMLQDMLKQNPDFQDDDGELNPAAWNAWVDQVNNRGSSWNDMFDGVAEDVRPQVFLGSVLAPAGRVLDSQVEEQLQQRHASIAVKFAKVEAPISLEEEAITKQYEENQEQYRKPSTNGAEYIAIPLTPEIPLEANDAVKRVKEEGRLFSDVAKELSNLTGDDADDLGWIALTPTTLEHRKAIFDLQVGELSELIYGPNGYFLYTVEEERTSEEGVREVHARQMFFESIIDVETRQGLMETGTAIHTKANEEGSDLKTAIEGYPYELKAATGYTTENESISGIPDADLINFRAQMIPSPEENATYRIVMARTNIYVGKAHVEQEGDIPPLEEIREEVVLDAEAAFKREEAYTQEVEALTDKILEANIGLDQVSAQFPDITFSVQSAPETKASDTPYLGTETQSYLSTAQLITTFAGKEPGTVEGPIRSIFGDYHLVELVSLTLPSDEEQAEFAEEKDEIRASLQRQAQMQRQEDYLSYLYDWAQEHLIIDIDTTLFKDITGVDLNALEATV